MQKNTRKKKGRQTTKDYKKNAYFKFGVHLLNPPEKTNIEPEKDEFQATIFSIPKFRRHLGSTASTKWNPYLGGFRWNVGGMPWKYP